MSLGTIGAGLGAVTFSPLIVFLLDFYTYIGCMLILAAISLHCCLAGALLHPFIDQPLNTEVGDENLDPALINGTSDSFNMSNSKTTDRLEHASGITHGTTVDACAEKLHVNPVVDTPSCMSVVSQTVDSAWKCLKKAIKLFQSVTMLIYCGCIFMMPVAHGMVIFFIADAAVLRGASDTQASLVLSIFGACDCVGRIAWGVIFDLKVVRCRRRMMFSLLGIPRVINISSVQFEFSVMSLVERV